MTASPLEFPAELEPTQSLFCLSFNDPSTSDSPQNRSTILILHGALDSTKAWKSVGAALDSTKYHTLIPALPLHHESSDIGPLTIEHTSDLLAKLVRRKAIGSKVHLVGFSFSVRIALDFAARYASLVTDVVVCGYGRFPFPDAIAPQLYRVSYSLERCIPHSVVKWLMHGQEFDTSDSMPLDARLAKAITGIHNAPLDKIPTLSQRCLIVAATQKGFLPSDSVELAESLLRKMQEGNQNSRAGQFKGGKHPWVVQQPEKFVDLLQKWIMDDAALPRWLEEL